MERYGRHFSPCFISCFGVGVSVCEKFWRSLSAPRNHRLAKHPAGQDQTAIAFRQSSDLCLGLAETTSDLDKLNQIFNITPLALLPSRAARLPVDPQGAGVAGAAGGDAVRGRARRVPPARRVRRLRRRHRQRGRRVDQGGLVWRWPTASRSTRASPTSTGCSRAAAWTACC